MDLWQLQIFSKVVELESFSRAGRQVHLSQPTVSSHIKALETHCGCRLIDRYAKAAVPTQAGRLLYRYASRLLALRDEAEKALGAFHGKIEGRLVMGGSTIPGAYWLPPIIAEFCRQYPQVTVSMTVDDTAKIVSRTISGELEMSVVGAAATERLAEQQKLADDKMCLVVPAGHRWAGRRQIEPSELLTEPFVLREAGSGTLRTIADRLKSSGYGIENLTVVAEMGSTEAVRQSVIAGLGVSVLSIAAVSRELASGALASVEVKGLNLQRCFYLTLRRHRSLSPAGNALVGLLRRRFTSDNE